VRARASGNTVLRHAIRSETDALTPERQAEISKLVEKQLRLIVLAIPHWHSHP
jgi:hypothetical protein